MQTLKAGTVVPGKMYTYTIQKVLGQGAFGVTYLANIVIKGPLGKVTVPVALKEFFSKELDSRLEDGTVSARTEDGIAYKYAKAFRRESENLSKMAHPGIVNVLEAFDANGTCYYSMEYLSGGSLDEKVKGKGMPEEEALPIIAKIGEAVSYMHERKMMHLDLKPKNVMLKDDGTPVVIDFGLSKQYDDSGEPESSSSIGLGTPGYAPLEQANQTSGKGFQPTLDIYALGATLYKMLTGKTPPLATVILNQRKFPTAEMEAKNVSAATIDVIRQSMAPFVDERPQTVASFLSMLGFTSTIGTTMDDDEDDTPMKSEPEPRPELEPEPSPEPEPGQKPASGPKTWLWALLGGVAIAAIVAAFVPGRVKESPTRGEINGHEWVDLGLPSGLKWAACNMGASSPEEDGSYFAWGETSPKSVFTWENCAYRVSGDSWENTVFSKYNTRSERGTVDNKTCLDPSDDAAFANWGGSWRIPTSSELDELQKNCTWTWTTQGGRDGYKVTSKKNGESIFLPAAGYGYGANRLYVGSVGYYWTSSLQTKNTFSAISLTFSSDGCDWYNGARRSGFPIRPVTDGLEK